MSESTPHRLRKYIDSDSPEITDQELDEVETLIPFDEYLDEENSGNFILTKDLVDRELAVEHMCCGITTRDINLASRETIYFAFDSGH